MLLILLFATYAVISRAGAQWRAVEFAALATRCCVFIAWKVSKESPERKNFAREISMKHLWKATFAEQPKMFSRSHHAEESFIIGYRLSKEKTPALQLPRTFLRAGHLSSLQTQPSCMFWSFFSSLCISYGEIGFLSDCGGLAQKELSVKMSFGRKPLHVIASSSLWERSKQSPPQQIVFI